MDEPTSPAPPSPKPTPPRQAQSFARRAARELTPPIVWRAAKRLKGTSHAPPEWTYEGTAWPQAATRSWDEPTIASKQAEDWQAFRERLKAEGPSWLSRSSAETQVTLDQLYVSLDETAGQLAEGYRIRVLDYGGGLGQFALIAAQLLPHLELDYHVVEVPTSVALGRKVTPEVTFHDTILAATRSGPFDLTIASGSLHFVENWKRVVNDLARATRSRALFARVPVLSSAPTYAAMQHPQKYGYDSSFPSWMINEADFLATLKQCGLRVVKTAYHGDGPRVSGAPEQSANRAYHCARRRPGEAS